MGMFETVRHSLGFKSADSEDDFVQLSTTAASSDDYRDQNGNGGSEFIGADAGDGKDVYLRPRLNALVKLVPTAAHHAPMTKENLQEHFHHRGIIRGFPSDAGTYDVEFKGQIVKGLRTPEHFKVVFRWLPEWVGRGYPYPSSRTGVGLRGVTRRKPRVITGRRVKSDPIH